jgi:hypothetical protein
MNTTTHTTVRRVATTVVLAGAVVLTATPAFARVAPVDIGAGSDATAGPSTQISAKVEQMERAMRDQQPAQPSPGGTSNSSSVPVSVLALLGGGLVAGAAGFTVYRFRHHGPVSAATA